MTPILCAHYNPLVERMHRSLFPSGLSYNAFTIQIRRRQMVCVVRDELERI
jgi:hypothetical protein